MICRFSTSSDVRAAIDLLNISVSQQRNKSAEHLPNHQKPSERKTKAGLSRNLASNHRAEQERGTEESVKPQSLQVQLDWT